MMEPRARVRAAERFVRDLDAAGEYLLEQDAAGAAQRFADLQRQSRQARAVLAWAPASGRPARFLHTRSEQGRDMLRQVKFLAARAGLPALRETLAGSYIVLYAHSDTEVLLLTLKHQRQLQYRLDET